jgi:hypothetical protein
MAREDADINSAESSFSILLGEAGHLDQHYTVFGRLERGYGALGVIENAEVSGSKRPISDLRIISAEIVPQAQVDSLPLAPARDPAPARATSDSGALPMGANEVLAGICLIIALAFAIGWGGRRWSVRLVSSLGLLIALIAGVLVFGLITVDVQKTSWGGAILFLALVLLFRLMSQFESTSLSKAND